MRFKSIYSFLHGSGMVSTGVTRVVRDAAIAIIASTSLSTFSAEAQTSFQWPSVAIDFGRYGTVEECLAATKRVRDSVFLRSAARYDTSSPATTEITHPLPEAARLVARQCAEKYKADEFPTEDSWEVLVQVYLHAGQRHNAHTLLVRRLARIPHDSIAHRDLVVDTAVAAYLAAQPAELRIADSLLAQATTVSSDADLFLNRIELNTSVFLSAQQAGDSSVARHTAARIETLSNDIPTEIQGNPLVMFRVSRAFFEAARYLTREAALDSLQVGTASYLALHQSIISRMGSIPAIDKSDAVGASATPIQADFWFFPKKSDGISSENGSFSPGGATPPNESSANQSSMNTPKPIVRPTRGRISLIVFLSHECNMRGPMPINHRSRDCIAPYSALRRIARQFPDLEITLVAQTYGFFSVMAPVPPQIEADSLHSWWMGFHRLPGALAVHNTQSWNLDAPDGRRINVTDPNIEAYAYGTTISGAPYVWPGKAFLIDEDGVIVHSGWVGSIYPKDRLSEIQFTELIDALFARKSKRTQAFGAE